MLILFGLLRIFSPKITPDVGNMARLGSAYIRPHFVDTAWWALGLLAASCLLAWILGRHWPDVAGGVTSGRISFTSAWWELFHMNPDTRIYVSCELLDGTYVAGYLLTYSTEPDEISDRELTLASPMAYRAPGGRQPSVLPSIDAFSIKVSQMRYLGVSYIELGGNKERERERDDLQIGNELAITQARRRRAVVKSGGLASFLVYLWLVYCSSGHRT
jgi:hypothetical protein